MSTYAERSPADPQDDELTVEAMFRGLPPVALEEPSRHDVHRAPPGLPSALLDAIRHHG